MKLRPLCSCAIASLSLVMGGGGLDAQPSGAANATPELDLLVSQVKQTRTTDYSAVVARLEQAASSPQAAQSFFFECVQKLDFRRDLEISQKFENWKREFLKQWQGHDLGVVLQLQMQYQALVLHTAQDKSKEAHMALVPLWLHYVEAIVDHPKDASFGAGFLSQPANGSIFNKALKLQQMAGTDGFAVGALELGRIFDTYIHPYVAKANRASAWKRRIELQKRFAEEVLLPTEVEDFNTFELPGLEWRSRMDIKFADGAKDPADVKEAYQFIQQHIHHPEAEKWVHELKGVVGTP